MRMTSSKSCLYNNHDNAICAPRGFDPPTLYNYKSEVLQTASTPPLTFSYECM